MNSLAYGESKGIVLFLKNNDGHLSSNGADQDFDDLWGAFLIGKSKVAKAVDQR